MQNISKFKFLFLLILLFSIFFITLFFVSDKIEYTDDASNNGDNLIVDDELDSNEPDVEELYVYDTFITLSNFSINSKLNSVIKTFLSFNTSNFEKGVSSMINTQYIDNNIYYGSSYDIFQNTRVIFYNNESIITYFIEGYVGYTTYSTNEFDKKSIFIVQVDESNKTFNLIPTEFNSLEEAQNSDIKNSTEEIEKNDYNEFSVIKMSNDDIAKRLLISFTNDLFNFPELTYNKINSSILFDNYDSFIEFRNTNTNELLSESVVSYEFESVQSSNIFIINGLSFQYRFQLENVYDYNVSIENIA